MIPPVQPPPNLLQILFRGLVIEAKPANGGLIDLNVRTDKQDARRHRRIAYRLAHLFYRLGDILNPRHEQGTPRVIQQMVLPEGGDGDQPAHVSVHIVERGPVDLANGDASYKHFILKSCVENRRWRLVRAIHAAFGHEFPQPLFSVVDVLNVGACDRIHVMPDKKARAVQARTVSACVPVPENPAPGTSKWR